MYRHHDQTRRVHELVRGGALGRLAFVRGTMSFTLGTPGSDPRTVADLDGGALLDLGCYCVSAARLLAGQPTRVHAEQVATDGGVDARLAATLRCRGDVLVQFDVGLDLPRRDRLEVVGTEATLTLTDPWHCRRPTFVLEREYVVEEVRVARANPYRLELEDFAAAVRGLAPPLLGWQDCVEQACVLQALSRSAAEGRPITVE
jgi:predicted dehydrogenase